MKRATTANPRAKDANGLTQRQRLFVEAYATSAQRNGRAAAKLAGYVGDDRTLAVTAHRLLRRAAVSAYLAEIYAKALARSEAEREEGQARVVADLTEALGTTTSIMRAARDGRREDGGLNVPTAQVAIRAAQTLIKHYDGVEAVKDPVAPRLDVQEVLARLRPDVRRALGRGLLATGGTVGELLAATGGTIEGFMAATVSMRETGGSWAPGRDHDHDHELRSTVQSNRKETDHDR